MTPEPAAPSGPAGPRRGTALAAAALVFLALLLWAWGVVTPGAVAGPATPNGGAVLVSLAVDTSIDAGVVLLWAAAAYGLGRRSTGRWTTAVDPLLAAVTAAAVGIGVLGFIVLGSGLAGVLTRPVAWTLLLGGVAALPWRHWTTARVGQWLRSRDRRAWVACAFAVPLALLVAASSLPPGFLWKPLDPHPYDVVSYHLQVPREWYDAGRIVPLPHNSFSYFPMGQEMHDLLLMHLLGGAWAAMYACQLVSVTLTLLTAAAVVGLVRTVGGGGGAAWLAGLLTLCVPWTLMLGSVAYVESGAMLYGVLAVGWALLALSNPTTRRDRPGLGRELACGLAARPEPREGALVLAGVCAGLAGGIKYTALAMTAVPVFVLWPLFAWPVLGRAMVRPWLLGGIACTLAMAPWLVRNAVWTADPVFPLATSVFGNGLFTADQVDRYALAHAPPPGERSLVARGVNAWRRVGIDPQFAYGLVPLTALAVLGVRRSARGRFAAAVLLATAAVWLLLTHDEPRFLAPAIPLAAVLIGFALAARPRAAGAGVVVVVAVCGFGLLWTFARLRPALDLGRQGLFRIPDLTAVEPPGVKEARESGGRLALVGDAQAYFYAMPPGRLKYRGVFDVNVPPGVSLVDGWLGEPVERLRAEGYWVLIAPGELVRLGRTYAHLPPPAPPYDDPAGAPVVLPPTRATP